MTLVNYAYHAGVTDSKDWLSKLRTFAVAQGWNGADYQVGVTWDTAAPYTGWIAGSGDFLQLTSACYGSCDKANYRFYAYNYVANEDIVYNTAHTTSSYSTSVATWPYDQDAWGGRSGFTFTSMPSSVSGIDKAWFFGNQQYIYAVCQYDDYLVPTWHMGAIDLFPEYRDRTDCAFWGCSNWNGDSVKRVWDQHHLDMWHCGLLPSFSIAEADTNTYYNFDAVYFSGKAQDRNNDGASYSFWHQGGIAPVDIFLQGLQAERGKYNFCKNVVRTYGPNGRRIAFKVDFFAKDTSVGNIVPLGKTPFYIVPFNGLAPGDTITENGMSYMCFPFTFTYINKGFAFRIA